MLEIAYSFLSSPNVVFLLFVVALLGIHIELAHPGVSVPGVVGGLAAILFFIGALALTPNWLGLVVMLIAFAMFVLDVHLATYSLLTLGAAVVLALGALLFFNSGGVHSSAHINPWVVYCTSAIVGGIGLLLLVLIARIRRLPVTTGVEGMIGARAIALTPLQPLGRVKYAGENWNANVDRSYARVEPGEQVQIMAVEGLRLRVRPLESQSKSEEQQSYAEE